MVEALDNTIQVRKAEVSVGPLPPALGDPTAVEQIFGNLVGNALHYLDPVPAGPRGDRGAAARSGQGAGRDADVLRQGQRAGHSRGVSAAGLPRLPTPARRRGPGRRSRTGPRLSHGRRLGGRIWLQSRPAWKYFLRGPAAGAGGAKESASPVLEGTRITP